MIQCTSSFLPLAPDTAPQETASGSGEPIGDLAVVQAADLADDDVDRAW
ncbi:hypothetical protein [Streptosporangium amethystogenes]|nr:hypothetical protein [Streptosporangium amethystogenes]